MNTMTNIIKEHIINGDIPNAILELQKIAPPEYQSELILILSQYEKIKRDERLGIISYSEVNIHISRINLSLIKIYENEVSKQKPILPNLSRSDDDLERYAEWNDQTAFHLLEKKIEIDFSTCSGRLADPSNNLLIEYLEQIVERKKNTQDIFIMPASSSMQYPIFDTIPKPDKVLNLETLKGIPDERKMYQAIAFFDVSKYSNNNIFSIKKKNYLPADTCAEKSNSVSIGAQYSCNLYIICLSFSIDARPKSIDYFEIPEFNYSTNAIGISYNKFKFIQPALFISETDSIYNLTWNIPSPKIGYIYEISWCME